MYSGGKVMWAVLSGGDRNPMSEVIDEGVPSVTHGLCVGVNQIP